MASESGSDLDTGGGQYFESDPSRLLFDFSTVPVYPSPRLTEDDARIQEEFLEWFRRPQRHHQDRVLRQLERQHPSAFRVPKPGPGNLDELAFAEPIRTYDDALNTITQIAGDNLLDTVAKMCAKNNDDVYTFRTTDTALFVQDDFDDVIRMFAESLVGSRLPLQHWRAKYPKSIILFPQYVPPARTGAHPGHYWLLVLECATGQAYLFDSLDRDTEHEGLTFAREATDSKLAATLYRSGVAMNICVPSVIAAPGSLQGHPDEANSFLYTARWIQLLNERYYQPILDMDFRHDQIFRRNSGRNELKLHSRFTAQQPSPLSYLTDLQHDPFDPRSVDLSPSAFTEPEVEEQPGGRNTEGHTAPVEEEDMEIYRSWLHKELHRLQIASIEQNDPQHYSTSTSDQLVHDLQAFQPHVSTLVASHAITSMKAAGVLVRVPQNADSCTTSSVDLEECSALVVPLLPGSKVILGDIGTVKHYRHGQLTAPLESDGQMAGVVFRQSDQADSKYSVASNVEKVMIGVAPDGNAYARNMTRGMHQDAKGDADARIFHQLDKDDLAEQRPLDWQPQVTVDGLDIRRLPAVGPLQRIARIVINDCVWLWISPASPQIPEPKIPPFVPDAFNAEHLTALVEELQSTVHGEDTYGLSAIREIENFLVEHRRHGGALDTEAVDDICIRITRLRHEQRKALAEQHGNDETTVDIHEHTFLEGMRAPPTHRRPLRPAWQRLLGGAKSPPFADNPETKKGYYGPMDWMGGAQITREAVRLPVYTDGHSSENATELARVIDVHLLEELQQKRLRTTREGTQYNLEDYVENTAETHMAQRHFAYSPLRADNRPPDSDDGGNQMEENTVHYFHDQVLHELTQREDMDCMLFGRGMSLEFLHYFLSGVPAAVMAPNWSHITPKFMGIDAFFPDGKMKSFNHLEYCVRKRYWLFLSPKAIPTTTTVPRGENNRSPLWVRTGTNASKYVKLPLTEEMIKQVNNKDTTEKDQWKVFIEYLKEKAKINLPFEEGTCGYTIDDPLKILTDGEAKLLSKEVLDDRLEWHPLANAHDAHVLLAHNIWQDAYRSTSKNGRLHITFYPKRPKDTKDPSEFHEQIHITANNHNSHWRVVIYDSYNGQTWLHDPAANEGKILPAHYEKVFLMCLNAFLRKYNWLRVMKHVGMSTKSRPVPVAPTKMNLLDRTPNIEQLTGWACGYLALGVILNFFFDYRRRQSSRNNVETTFANRGLMLHSGHTKPKEERMGVILQGSLQAWQAGRRERASPPPPKNKNKMALVNLPTVEWEGRRQRAQGPSLDFILNSYQQANRLPLSLLAEPVHHQEARDRAIALLEQAGAILFSVNRHQNAGDFGDLVRCNAPCEHAIDILPVEPGQCVILTEDPVETAARSLSPEGLQRAREDALRLRRSHQLLVGNARESGFIRYSAALWGNLEEAKRDAEEYDIPVMVNFVNMLDRDDKDGVNTTLQLPNTAFIRLGSRVWCWVRRQNKDGGKWEKNLNERRMRQVEASALTNHSIKISELEQLPAVETLRWFIREITTDANYRVYLELNDLLPGVNGVKSALYRSPVYGRETKAAPRRKRTKPQVITGPKPGPKPVQKPVQKPTNTNKKPSPKSPIVVPPVVTTGTPLTNQPDTSRRQGILISSIVLQKSTGPSKVRFQYKRATELSAMESVMKAIRLRGANRRQRFRLKRRKLEGRREEALSDEYASDDSIDDNLERVQPFGIRPRRRLRRDPDWEGPAAQRPALYEYSSGGDSSDPDEHTHDPRKRDRTVDQRAYNRKRRRLNKAAAVPISTDDAERNMPVTDLVRRTNWIDLGDVVLRPSTEATMTTNEELALREVARLQAQKAQLETRIAESSLSGESGTSVQIDERLRAAKAEAVHLETELQTLLAEHAIQMLDVQRRAGSGSGGELSEEDRQKLADLQKELEEAKKTCKDLEKRLEEEKATITKVAGKAGISEEDLEELRKQGADYIARNRVLESSNIEGIKDAIRKARALHRRQLRRAEIMKEHEAERERLETTIRDDLLAEHMDAIEKTKEAYQSIYPKGSTPTCPVCLKGANSAQFKNHLHGYSPRIPDPKRKLCGLAGIDRFHPNGAPKTYGKTVPGTNSEYRADYEAAVAEATRPPKEVQELIDQRVTEELEELRPGLEEELRKYADDYTDEDDAVDISDLEGKTKEDMVENFTVYVTAAEKPAPSPPGSDADGE